LKKQHAVVQVESYASSCMHHASSSCLEKGSCVVVPRRVHSIIVSDWLFEVVEDIRLATADTSTVHTGRWMDDGRWKFVCPSSSEDRSNRRVRIWFVIQKQRVPTIKYRYCYCYRKHRLETIIRSYVPCESLPGKFLNSTMSTSDPNQKQDDDNGNNPSSLADIYVGTAGYSYAHWRKGVFYPSHVTQANELRHYSGVLSAVEINASFHGVPREETLQTWALKAKDGFQFSFKVPQAITHEKRLENIEDSLTFFLKRLHTGLRVANSDNTTETGSPRCLGPILFQLPPSLYKSVDKIHDIARHIISLGMANLKVAFEFRNKSWYCEEVFEAMHQYNFGLCENISPDSSTYHTTKVTSKNWHYIRCHKNGDRSVTLYDDQQLASITDVLVERRKQNIFQYCYFLNDHEGNGPRNATTLMKMIKERSSGLSSGSVPFISNSKWRQDPVAPSIRSMFAKSGTCNNITSSTPLPKATAALNESPKRSVSTKSSFFSPSAKRPKVSQSSSATIVSTSSKPQYATTNKKKGSITHFFSKKT
jgi:uncharacterized protein YecE (DUF72 family)